MRFATSCFNLTLYKKNLARFWPLWTAWTVLWAFMMPLNLLNEMRYSDMSTQGGVYRFYRDCLNLNSMSEVMLTFGAVYAVLIVMAVFGYLYNHRAAATMHALPVRRETLFVTNYLSGLTFFVVPNALVYAAAALVELTTLPAELSAVAMGCLWDGFWVSIGTLLFLYSFAVFCAQFTGNILALPAFYGILNFLVYVMYALCVEFAGQIFYGGWPFLTTPGWVELLTPIYALMMAAQWNYIPLSAVWNSELEVPVFDKLQLLGFDDPGLIAGYAVAGIVLAVLALLVYRRRHIETAGDVVSVKIVRPIFRVGVAVCTGLCGGIVTAAFFGWYSDAVPTVVLVFFWTLIGYLAAEMLLQKSFRVLKKAWKGSVVTAAVLCALAVGCFVDVFGVETWLPDPGKVVQATLHMDSTYPSDDASHFTKDITDGVEIEKVVDLHQAIINDFEKYGESYFGEDMMYVRINYIMDNGVEYYKRYDIVNLVQNDINVPGTTTYKLDQFVNDPEVLEWAYNMEQAQKSTVVATQLKNVAYPTGRYGEEDSMEGAQEIWEAVQADFAAGNLGRRYLFDDEVRRTQTYRTDLTLRFLLPEEQSEGYEDLYYERSVATQEYKPTMEDVAYTWNWSMTITLTPKAERTIAALEKYYDLGGAYELALHE